MPNKKNTPRDVNALAGQILQKFLAAAKEREERAPEEIRIHPPEKCHAHTQKKENTDGDHDQYGVGSTDVNHSGNRCRGRASRYAAYILYRRRGRSHDRS